MERGPKSSQRPSPQSPQPVAGAQSPHLRQRTAMTITTRTSTTPTTAVPAIRASCSRQVLLSAGGQATGQEELRPQWLQPQPWTLSSGFWRTGPSSVWPVGLQTGPWLLQGHSAQGRGGMLPGFVAAKAALILVSKNWHSQNHIEMKDSKDKGRKEGCKNNCHVIYMYQLPLMHVIIYTINVFKQGPWI